MDIDRHIFRGVLTCLLNDITFMGLYEHEISRPFTIVLKAGPYLFTNYSSMEEPVEISASAAGELRYYFNLRRRIKHEKTVRNFSAGYLSLEPYVISKPLVFFKDPGYDKRPRRTGIYINIGFQRQVKRSYINCFIGTHFFGKIYDNGDLFEIIHGGIGIGLVFY